MFKRATHSSITFISPNEKRRQASYCTRRGSILQHLNDALVARGCAVVGGPVSKAVNQLCVGPASQESCNCLNAVTLTRHHQCRPAIPNKISYVQQENISIEQVTMQ